MTDAAEGVDAILGFWFGEMGPDRWWLRSAATDQACIDRFRGLWEEWRSHIPASFIGSPRAALAGVVLFDQFSRNMFRGHADAFSTDPLALAIAKGAIDCGLDLALTDDERSFLYMPFQHSENIADQERSLLLFTELGNPSSLDFARKHRDMIAKYGRFPARNAALGRPDRPGEEQGIAASGNW